MKQRITRKSTQLLQRLSCSPAEAIVDLKEHRSRPHEGAGLTRSRPLGIFFDLPRLFVLPSKPQPTATAPSATASHRPKYNWDNNDVSFDGD